ncbi:MAG: Serine/threonine protein kinase [Candidatus Woesebacteria bacterium GW2011_GWD1_47_21]|uniref:Serine/threonine protein kinase n=2 Tax=Candidatus Woeseibacteriota TaxID=1752722 RepID=A0A0G1SN95_9BACT|nr:MAG: Serine/threonine protein kinase [Candidatus Woesebacteria bacterium GW2011_GWF1_46_13]KKU70937.1 MAG: Serine/threonine protein kinase [Candidatus Woesebacteria bacterium GW2011_GWD1_47_21]
MTRLRVLLGLLTLLVVGLLGLFLSLYARGYRFDGQTFRFKPSGLLVVKSDPSGAQVFVNGELSTATDTTVSLAPGTYDVSIRKESFHPWNKRLVIEKEVVTEAIASLFRVAPSLSSVTFSGVVNPVISADGTRIAYATPPSREDPEKGGLWAIETVNLPIGFARDPRRVTDGDLTAADWQFSPDGREILVSLGQSVFLLDASTFTPQARRVNVAARKEIILAGWEEERGTRLSSQIKILPDELVDILQRKVSSIVFSPDETKILYTASGSATIRENLIKPLPGSSSQKQERDIKEGHTYVYDIKEDRNFLIDEGAESLLIDSKLVPELTRRLAWFPTSKHLVLSEAGKITIIDYDGTNRQLVYSGSYVSPHAYPFGSTSRLLILTSLGADTTPNLYSLTLK